MLDDNQGDPGLVLVEVTEERGPVYADDMMLDDDTPIPTAAVFELVGTTVERLVE